MRKLLIVFALAMIIFVSGCTTEEDVTGNVILEAEPELQITYSDGTCRQDTDCLVAHCEGIEENYCMNSIQVETQMKCYKSGTKMVTEKDYNTCGCIEGICASK